MLFTWTVISHAGGTLQALGIHHYTQHSGKETHFTREIDGTTILINKVSKSNTLTMTIPGSTGKLHRIFRRHDDSGEHEK
jgi:hypothetical protein